MIAGHNAFWNRGMTVGCYEYLASAIFMGVGFLSAAICLSEMTSSLPFAGKWFK